MVCDRCKMAVKQILEQAELHPVAVELGVVTIEENNLSDEKRLQLAQTLKSIGFELLEDQRQQLMNQIKIAIIDLVHYKASRQTLTLSAYLSDKFHLDF